MDYFFNSSWYLESYPEVIDFIHQGKFKNAFQHYINIGAKKRYSPNPDFDEEFYVEANEDVKEAVENGKIKCGYHHYLTYGEDEKRSSRPISMDEIDARQALISIFDETKN